MRYIDVGSIVRGNRGDAPQARGEAMRLRPASQARRAPRVRLYALIICGAGRVTNANLAGKPDPLKLDKK